MGVSEGVSVGEEEYSTTHVFLSIAEKAALERSRAAFLNNFFKN